LSHSDPNRELAEDLALLTGTELEQSGRRPAGFAFGAKKRTEAKEERKAERQIVLDGMAASMLAVFLMLMCFVIGGAISWYWPALWNMGCMHVEWTRARSHRGRR
jgi:hypothetical protein